MGWVACEPLENVETNHDSNKEHPGGKDVILKYAGKDATEPYEQIHSPSAIERSLRKEDFIGETPPNEEARKRPTSKEKLRIEQERLHKPPLARMLNLNDFGVFTIIT